MMPIRDPDMISITSAPEAPAPRYGIVTLYTNPLFVLAWFNSYYKKINKFWAKLTKWPNYKNKNLNFALQMCYPKTNLQPNQRRLYRS